MADDRIYIKCNICGGKLFLGKQFGFGAFYWQNYGKMNGDEEAHPLEDRLNKFFEYHVHPEYSPENEHWNGDFCIDYEWDNKATKISTPRYIDADAQMKELRDFVRRSNSSDFAPAPTWNDAVSLVGSAPTADVVERKKGKWEVCNILDYAQRPTGRKIGRCPFCQYLTGEFRSRVDYFHKLTHYCPNCGAEMKGENDGEVH